MLNMYVPKHFLVFEMLDNHKQPVCTEVHSISHIPLLNSKWTLSVDFPISRCTVDWGSYSIMIYVLVIDYHFEFWSWHTICLIKFGLVSRVPKYVVSGHLPSNRYLMLGQQQNTLSWIYAFLNFAYPVQIRTETYTVQPEIFNGINCQYFQGSHDTFEKF